MFRYPTRDEPVPADPISRCLREAEERIDRMAPGLAELEARLGVRRRSVVGAERRPVLRSSF